LDFVFLPRVDLKWNIVDFSSKSGLLSHIRFLIVGNSILRLLILVVLIVLRLEGLTEVRTPLKLRLWSLTGLVFRVLSNSCLFEILRRQLQLRSAVACQVGLSSPLVLSSRGLSTSTLSAPHFHGHEFESVTVVSNVSELVAFTLLCGDLELVAVGD
jgi:hypothetical protein